ncbi:MAG: heme lyase CcmF/NrfE family subunit [Alphaproteobacteria bacterium]|nr:heme lyase CcmF/NrfE family subunit [Alphaproteobacteria bacterium]
MIIELGHFAVILALLAALLQAALPLAGAVNGNGAWMAVARPAAYVQCALIACGFLALMAAHVTDDFSVLNVVQHSHTLKPLLYKFAGVWGNHEGSLLLWVLLLALFGAALARFPGALAPAQIARILSVQGMVGAGFLLFILFTSNPFARLFPPALNGEDLNPLLQDPALALHPPLLYAGYVGFSLAFSFSAAALLEGRLAQAWARTLRPWVLTAWGFLTAGIALGSFWAYYELGWGGWWFWDPVENASLLPWLSGTALVHCVAAVAARGTLRTWAALLAIITFGFSLLGTFLVRSGVLTSVHAFAVDPLRGIFILVLLALAVGGGLALFAARAPRLGTDAGFAPVSREGGLVLNNLFLLTACATVLLGTLYPLALDALGAGAVSVGAPYFNKLFVPLALPLLVIMAAGPGLPWRRGDLLPALKRLRAAGLLTFCILILAAYLAGGRNVLAIAALAAGFWVIAASVSDRAIWRAPRTLPAAQWRRIFAHAGLGLAVIGMAGSAFTSETVTAMRAGQKAQIAGHTVQFDGAHAVAGPNYGAWRGDFALWRGTGFVAPLQTEKRYYPVANMHTTEAAIAPGWRGNIFATLGEKLEGEGKDAVWSVRIAFHPLIMLIWLGALFMAGAGLLGWAGKRAHEKPEKE